MTRTDDPDLYADLGLTRAATRAEIVHAYRVLLRRHHPDTRTHHDPALASSGEEVLHRVLAAYAVLGDPARRASYDQQQRTHHPGREQPTAIVPPATTTTGSSPTWPREASQPPIRFGPVQWHRPR